MNPYFTNNNELTFTKNYDSITASNKLTPLDKLLIARVLNWQQSKLICTLSNQALANELGVCVKTIKNAITKLNSTPFFQSKETSKFNEFGKWTNSKQIIIDEELLFEFINQEPTKKLIEIPTETSIKKFDYLDEPANKESMYQLLEIVVSTNQYTDEKINEVRLKISTGELITLNEVSEQFA